MVNIVSIVELYLSISSVSYNCYLFISGEKDVAGPLALEMLSVIAESEYSSVLNTPKFCQTPTAQLQISPTSSPLFGGESSSSSQPKVALSDKLLSASALESPSPIKISETMLEASKTAFSDLDLDEIQ